MFDLLDTHFWLICGLWVGFGNAIVFRRRHQKWIARGEITRAEANRFFNGILCIVLLPCLNLWILQHLSGNHNTPEFLAWGPPHNFLGSCTVNVAILLELFWVQTKRGS